MKITFNLISKEETHGGIQMRHIVCMSTFVALLCGAANIFHVHIVGGNSSCRHWRKFLLARIKSSLFRSGGTRPGARGGGTPGRCCRRIQPGTRRRLIQPPCRHLEPREDAIDRRLMRRDAQPLSQFVAMILKITKMTRKRRTIFPLIVHIAPPNGILPMDRDGVEIMTIRCQDNAIITIKTVRLLRPAPKLRLLVNLQKLDDKKHKTFF